MSAKELTEHAKKCSVVDVVEGADYTGTTWIQARPGNKMAVYRVVGVEGERWDANCIIHDRDTRQAYVFTHTSLSKIMFPGSTKKKMQTLKSAPSGYYEDVVKHLIKQLKPNKEVRSSRPRRKEA